MNNIITVPCYTDTLSVLSGLNRLKKDLQDLQEEISTLIFAVETGTPETPKLFCHLETQLDYLAADVGKMQDALGYNNKDDLMIMPTPFDQSKESGQPVAEADPITGLYDCGEALFHLAETLPEGEHGLAHLLYGLSGEIKLFTEILDDGSR